MGGDYSQHNTALKFKYYIGRRPTDLSTVKRHLSGSGISPAIWRRVKMHSLKFKCTEMCALIENALLNLLNVTLNDLNKQFTFNTVYGMWLAQVCGTWRTKMCSLKNPGENPVDTSVPKPTVGMT